MKTEVTQARLRELLHYDPETGVFTNTPARGRRYAGLVVGAPTRAGYLHCTINNKFYSMHRLAWFYVHGEWPKGEIDHINGDRKDNRLANLRDVDRHINHQNLRGPMASNRGSGILGVYPANKCVDRWQSRIRVNGKPVHLGTFATKEQAHAAYVTAKRKFHEGCTI
jgi:hypothetical protein